MTVIRRLTALVGLTAMAWIGGSLVAEATGIGSGAWRQQLAGWVESVADPPWQPWQMALSGATMALVALVLIAAEFARPPKGTRILHPVHDTPSGSTQISGRAAINAAIRQVLPISGVVDADASMTRSTMTINVRVDDRSDLAAVETAARERLDHEFWINLGLADVAVNILITHHADPPRVR